MGLFTFTVGGGGLVLIGTWEALVSSSSSNPIQNPSSSPPSPLIQINKTVPLSLLSSSKSRTNPLTIVAVSLLSFFFIVNCIVSLLDAIDSHDRVGSALQLQELAISSLFFFYSVLCILVNFTNSIRLPSSLLNLIGLFAFVEEFLLFYLRRKDTSGIENRYFDLLLVPIGICLFSTVLELKSPKSNYPRLARGVGLILQGTWFLQMGFSFYTNLMAHGCSLHEKSRGNYTIRCKGHPEYHRARAIATLQFNCHLSFLVVLIAGFYSILSKKNGGGSRGDFTRYRPLGAEMQQLDNQSHFTLDSDGEDHDHDEEIKEENNVVKEKVDVKNSGMNGYGSHQ